MQGIGQILCGSRDRLFSLMYMVGRTTTTFHTQIDTMDSDTSPPHMHDNDGETVQLWHECGLDDGMWEIHAYEIES
jgi:hypothetical protein